MGLAAYEAAGGEAPACRRLPARRRISVGVRAKIARTVSLNCRRLAKAGREGDVVERQGGRLDQQARGLGPLGSRKVERARPELLDEQAAQVPGAVGESASEAFDALAIDHAVGDEPHGAAGHVGSQVPLR